MIVRRLIVAVILACTGPAALLAADPASAAPGDFSVAVHATPVAKPGDRVVVHVDVDAISSAPQTAIRALVTVPASSTGLRLFETGPAGTDAACTLQSATTIECTATKLLSSNGRTYVLFGLEMRLAGNAPLGTETVTAAVTTAADTNPADHTATDTFVVTDSGDVAVSIVGPDQPVRVGQLIKVRFVIENRGSYPTGVAFEIRFDDRQLDWRSPLDTGCGADPGGLVQCARGGCLGVPVTASGVDCRDIMPGASAVTVVTFRVLPGAVPRTSLTEYALAAPDTVPSNNVARLDLRVGAAPKRATSSAPTSRRATPGPETGSSAPIAGTGTSVGPELIGALSAVALGSLLVVAGHRRAERAAHKGPG